MAKSSPVKTQTTDQTTTQQGNSVQTLSPEQQQLMDYALPGIRDWAATVPQRYQGSQVAGFDPAQTQGQNMVLDAAGIQAGQAKRGTDANNFLMGDIWNPSTNSALQGAVDAAVRPITQQYQEVVRPALRDEFTGAGQVFGGSRRNLAETGAAGKYLQSVGDTSSKLVQDQYANNLNAYQKAIGMVPSLQAAAITPGVTTSGVGDIRQNMAQALIGQDVGNFNYDQLAPFLQSKDLISLLQGLPGGGVQTNTTGTTQGTNTVQMPTNPIGGGLGGAASGAAVGSMFGPIGTGVGAIGGGLLGYFGSK